MKPALRKTVTIVAILAAAVAVLRYAGVIPLHGYRTRAWELWSEPLFRVGTLPISPLFLIKAAAFLVALIFASRIGRQVLRTRLLSRTSIDPGLQYAIQVGTGYFIFIVGLIIGLQSVGLNLSSLAFITGIVGVGVGFGTQNIMNNFVSGLILLIERPIKVGDRIDVGDVNGDVVRIGARSTWVRTNDNIIIIVPNADFIANRVTNWTANDRQVRIRIPLGVGYSSDPDKVRGLLLAAAKARPDILAEPAADVIFLGFGDSSLDFELRVWTMERLRTPQILKSDLYFDIFRILTENQIEIPFPQRDLHVRSIEASLPIARSGS